MSSAERIQRESYPNDVGMSQLLQKLDFTQCSSVDSCKADIWLYEFSPSNLLSAHQVQRKQRGGVKGMRRVVVVVVVGGGGTH